MKNSIFSRLGSHRTKVKLVTSVSTVVAMALTVIGDGVYPLVEGRVKFGDDMLFPLLTNKTEKDFGLVDRILQDVEQR